MRTKGERFGRYVLEELLGEGGMGSVYRALDTVLHRRVALKLLRGERPDARRPDEASTRLLREARAAAAFEHPNAVRIYDVGEIDATPYIAMELVAGETLARRAADETRWTVKLRWLLDAAAALGAAHAVGLIHRDVTPRNVMVSDDGRVKVLDFGVARRMTSWPSGEHAGRPREDLPTLTAKGTVLGTPQYMAPEQLAGAPLDGRADQFGWGVMAYELLSGRRPWPPPVTLVGAIEAILSTRPEPLGVLVPALPSEVVEAVHRSLAKVPGERFASMQDLVLVLEPHASLPQERHSAPPSMPSLHGLVSSAREGADATWHRTDPAAETRADLTPAPTATGRRRARGWFRGAIVASAVVLLGAGATAGRWHGADVRVVPAAAAAQARPVAMLDLPLPEGAAPAALVAYRRGLQAQHDANDDAAGAAYRAAFELDPGFGAAHLRYAMLTLFQDVLGARAHFETAEQLRSSLGAHERVLLDAVEPLFYESPANWPAAEGRLAAASQANPGDAELAYTLARVRGVEGKLPEAIAAQDAALALDPTFAGVLSSRVAVRQVVGDVAGALEATDACLRASPVATSCLQDRVWAYSELGRCEDFDRDVRRVLTIDPGNGDAYEGLAEASLVLGKPADVAWEALRAGWKHTPVEEAPLVRARDRAWMSVVTGDLAGLDAALGEWRGQVAEREDRWSRFEVALARVEELEELGAIDRAAQVADEFLRAREGWLPDPGSDFWTAGMDGVPIMLETLARAGRITRAEQARRRAAWFEQWRARLAPRHVPYLWLFAYSDAVTTPAEAAEAMSALPELGPIPPFHPMHFAEAHLGLTYLLSGHVNEALASLERASHGCRISEEPFVWVRATLWLAQARQAAGDVAGACAAYGDVTRRWAGFGSRSVTVRQARRGMAALSCPP